MRACVRVRACVRAWLRACTQIDMHATSHTCCSTFLCRATRSRCASGAPSGVCLTARCPARHGVPHGTAYYIARHTTWHGAYPARYDIRNTGILHGIVSRLAWHVTRHGMPPGMAWRATRHGMACSQA